MYELKTNTAVRIAVGPLVDPTDGKTAETALTVTGLLVELYQIKNDGSAVVRTGITPEATGSNNDMVHITNDTAGVYDLELTAAQLNFLGNGRITFYDVDGFLVHWIDILVVSAAYFDWKYGSTKPEVNLADDAITAGKFDESTAFPMKSADTGSTAIARTGADSDTLETLSDEIAAVKAETAVIVEDTGTTLDTLIKDIPTVAEFEARTLVAAGYGTAANQSTIAGYIDTEVAAILAAVDTEVAAIKAKTDNLPATPAAVGSAMTLTAAYDAAKTAATQTSVNTIDDFLDTEIAAILADTNELQTDLVNGGRLDLLIDAIKAKTDNLPADPADQSAVEAAITAATSPLATSAALDAVDNYVDTEIAAIKAVTDKLDTAVELDGAVYRLTENALEQAPTGGGSLTVEDIVDGVLDEMLSAHAEVGSVGAGIAAAGSAGDPWSTALPGAYEEGTAGYLIGNNMPSAGSGSTPWPYRLTDAATGQPIAGAAVRVSTDAAGTITVASGTTDANGYATFNIDPGTYYIWRTCAGFLFNNPDTEVVS